LKLPVEPERLRTLFPSLTDEDIDAYVAVTTRVLADPRSRGRAMAEVMAAAQRASEREAGGAELAQDERLALRYLRAVGKMQG
jgi:ribosomal protein L12E/L44/L45/RPP1/RPP2